MRWEVAFPEIAWLTAGVEILSSFAMSIIVTLCKAIIAFIRFLTGMVGLVKRLSVIMGILTHLFVYVKEVMYE